MEHGRTSPQGPLDENEKRRLVLDLVTKLRCAACGKAYHTHDFVLVDRRPDVWVLGIQCRHCGGSAHVFVLMRLEAEPEPLIDLTPEEIKIADQWPPISADDVLDMHVLLQECDGDIESLFS